MMAIGLNVGAILSKRASVSPNKMALVFEGHNFSYRELNERSNRWANAFTDFGVVKGDRVGILLTNCNEFWEAFFGLAKIGVILVGLNWRLVHRELEDICRDSGLETLIFGKELSNTVDAARPALNLRRYVCIGTPTPAWATSGSPIGDYSPRQPDLAGGGDDPLVLLYTSGTTGGPKGIVRTHNNFLWNSASHMVSFDFRPDDRILTLVLQSTLAGIDFAFTAVYKGCTALIMKTHPFSPLGTLRILQQERVDAFIAVPTMLQLMAQVPNFDEYLRNVRWIVSVGAPLSLPLIQKYLDRGIAVQNNYGLAEVGGISISSRDDMVKKKESVGLPCFHTEIRVVDESESEVEPGRIGEIIVRGPSVMKEYWHQPETTKEATRSGWFHTGDLGKLDEEGYLYVVGRKKDVIIVGGENVYPAEIENLLCRHPKIYEVAVMGAPNEVWGETVCAIIRVKDGQRLTADEVIDFCRGNLAAFKVPRIVTFTTEPLPRNDLGKVAKSELRRRAPFSIYRENRGA
jgi:fatty-acyl-CoA synthase